MSVFYFREQKSGIAVELWYRDLHHNGKGKLEIMVFDADTTIYMSPTRAKNLMNMLENALLHLPKKSDEL